MWGVVFNLRMVLKDLVKLFPEEGAIASSILSEAEKAFEEGMVEEGIDKVMRVKTLLFSLVDKLPKEQRRALITQLMSVETYLVAYFERQLRQLCKGR